MPEFDPDAYLARLKGKKEEFDPDEYVRTHPDPNRGTSAKAREVIRGALKGAAQDAISLNNFLPHPWQPDAPHQGEALKKFADEKTASGWEEAGRWIGGTAPMLAAPELGLGELAGSLAGVATRASPTLATLAGMLKTGIHPESLAALIVGRHFLQKAATKAAPYVAEAGKIAGKVAEKPLAGAALREGEDFKGY